MKLRDILVLSALMIFTLAFRTGTGYGYTIDGQVDDWGIYLSATGADEKLYLDNHLPSGGLDIDVVTEDNASSNVYGWVYVGPGWSYGGIVKVNGEYKDMNSNYFDVEAIYFDNDQYNAYIAIVQGLPIDGGTAPGNPWFYPGDIAIDADNNPSTGEYGFEYGLKVRSENGFQQGYLYSVSDWGDVYYSQHNIANPYKILSGTSLNQIDFVYSLNQNTHYVLEAKIPLGLLGLSANPGDPIYPLRIHWTQQCGNDYLNLNADVNPVPEPTTLLLLGIGLIGLSTPGQEKVWKEITVTLKE